MARPRTIATTAPAPAPGSAPARAQPGRAGAVTAILGAVVLWSTSFAVTKHTFSALPPMTVAALRFLIALVPLGVMYLAQRPRVRPPPADRRRMAVGGLLGITCYFAGENYGLRFASATDAALVVGAFPIVALLLEAALRGTRPSRPKWLGVVAAAVGVALIVGKAPEGANALRPLGLVLCGLAGVAWAFYNFETRDVARAYPMPTLLFHQTLWGTVGLLPLALLEVRSWRWPPPGVWLSVFYLALLCSWVGYWLYAYGLRGVESSTAVTLLNLMPVLGVAFAVAFLGEAVTLTQLLGGAVVLFGVWVTVRASTPPSAR